MKRVVTALFLVPISVYSALFAPWWFFFAVIAIVALLTFREYASITESFAPLGYVAGILILIGRPGQILPLIVLSTLAAMCLARGAGAVLGIIYIFGSWKTGILLHDSFPQPAALGISA